MLRQARARQMRFEWVGVDAGDRKEPAFLPTSDDVREVFVADVHGINGLGPSGLSLPFLRTSGRGRPATMRQVSVGPVTV